MRAKEVLTATGSTHRSSNISTAVREASHAIERKGLAKTPGIRVRPIINSWELNDVYHLTHDAYVERGTRSPERVAALARAARGRKAPRRGDGS